MFTDSRRKMFMNSGKRKKCFVPALSIMILLMAGVMAWGDVTINETNFPDDNFRHYVSSNFDPIILILIVMVC